MHAPSLRSFQPQLDATRKPPRGIALRVEIACNRKTVPLIATFPDHTVNDRDPQSCILTPERSIAFGLRGNAKSVFSEALRGERMLQAAEFSVGFVADAQPLSLMLPRGKYEQPFLIVRREEEAMAVFIGTEHRFHAMPCANNTHWKGVIVPNIAIEVDQASMFNPEEGNLSKDALSGAIPACVDRPKAGAFFLWRLRLAHCR